MIEETAIVERSEKGYIWIRPSGSASECGSCESSGSCSSSFLGSLFQDRASKSIRVKNTINAKVNDTVVLGIHPQGLLSGSALIYLLPIAGLFLFAAMGKLLFGELLSIALGLFGLVFGLFLSKVISNSVLMKSKLELVALSNMGVI